MQVTKTNAKPGARKHNRKNREPSFLLERAAAEKNCRAELYSAQNIPILHAEQVPHITQEPIANEATHRRHEQTPKSKLVNCGTNLTSAKLKPDSFSCSGQDAPYFIL